MEMSRRGLQCGEFIFVEDIITVLVIVFIVVAIFVVGCFVVLFGLLFRLGASRIIKPKLLNSPKFVAQEKPGFINKTIAVTDIFQGILYLYKDRIEFVTKKNVSVFMFSEIFTVRHQHKSIFAIVLYSGEKHGIIVKPETAMSEWIDMINHQIELHKQNSPEDPGSAEFIYKNSIVNIYPTAAWKQQNGTLFLYKDRVEFKIIKVRPMNPFTRNHLDKVNYDDKKESIIIQLSQIYNVQFSNEYDIGILNLKLKYDCLRIETDMHKEYDIAMAPSTVIHEWVNLINNQMKLYK